jgi:hypothetical protein
MRTGGLPLLTHLEIQKPFAPKKMLSTGFIETMKTGRFFNIKFKISNLGKENKNLSVFFGSSMNFLPVFYLNKKVNRLIFQFIFQVF